MTPAPPRPPRWSRALLRAVLPRRDREVVPGDLDELYRDRVRRRGAREARWWYRRQVLGFALRVAGYAGGRRLRSLADPRRYRELLSVDALARDLRTALRRLLRRPGFAAVAVASLALGIGANTAVFSVVNAVLLREPAVEAPGRLVEVYGTREGEGDHGSLSYPECADLREASPVFSGVVAHELFIGTTDGERRPELLLGEVVSGNYFDVLGVEPAPGRGFVADRAGATAAGRVAVLSHDFWTERFGARPDVVGTTVRVNRRPFTVVGVAPEGFAGLVPGLDPDLWVPYAAVSVVKPAGGDRLASREVRTASVTARLRGGVTPERAREWVRAFSERIAGADAESSGDRRMTVIAARDVAVHPAVDPALGPAAGVLLGMVGLVLLIACTNLASFLLARAEDGRKDAAVRLALGAGRGALVRRSVMETALLSAAGAAGGVVLARWTLRLLVRFRPPLPVPVSLEIPVDGTVLAFTAGVATLAGLGLGLLPGLRATRTNIARVLGEAPGRETSGRRFSLRNGLVVAQVALSMVLLLGAGLFLRSLQQARSVDPGFDTGPAALLWADAELSGLGEGEVRATYRALKERLRAHPAVSGVAAADVLPLGLERRSVRLDIPGTEARRRDGFHRIDYAGVGPDYFSVMGIALLRGRGFRAADADAGTEVAVVSRAFERRFFPDRGAVGRMLESSGGDPVRIVGVAADTRVRALGEEPRPRIYCHLGQADAPARHLVVRGDGTGAELLSTARRVAGDVEPDLVFLEAKTMEEHLSISLFAPRAAGYVFGSFGLLALLLAAVGIHGVVSYAVATRTREMGIRLSLGAAPGEVVRMMVGGGMRLVALGGVLGLVLALGLAGLVSGLLIGIGPRDLPTFVGVPAALGAAALVAAYLPARRATSVDPVEALRVE